MKKQNIDIVIKQLTANSLPNEENLINMAGLIYSTDPYIYPAMFGDYDKARLLIPELIKRNDVLFGYSHCLVAEFQGKIIGTLLWNEENFNWTPELLREIANEKKVLESSWLNFVSKEYVSIYSKNREQTISFYSLCINPEYRKNGVGRKLFEYAIKAHPNYKMKLSVLENNHKAINLYQSLGFVIKEKYIGFSISEPRPTSILMERNA